MNEFLRKYFLLVAILGVTFLAFSPCLSNGFLNWDDPEHLLKNPATQSLDLPHVQRMFSTLVIKTYLPLTFLSFSIEHHFFGYDPFVFHLDNVLLHLGVVVLVYFLVLEMGFNLFVAGVAVLLFAIHPLHVESVAWVTERKDLLYSFFYLMSLISYVRYLKDQRASGFCWSLFWALASILSKPMALSLPLILWLFDWIYQRPFGKKVLFEKIPYVAIIVPVTLVSYVHHARIPFQDAAQAVLIFIWTATFYIWKFIFPGSLVPYYLLPKPVSILNPEYLLALWILGLVAFSLWRYRQKRWFVFAVLFYALSTFFLWRYDNFGESIVSDHYMYLPSFGFCLLLGIFIEKVLAKGASQPSVRKWGMLLLMILAFSGLAVKTYSQCYVWNNSYMLWTHVIEHTPGVALAHNNRGNLQPTAEAAIADYSQAIAIDPKFWEAYFNRAKINYQVKRYQLALDDLDEFLRNMSDDAVAFNLRGDVYYAMGNAQQALKDYQRAIELFPRYATAYANRGAVYLKLGQYESALADLDKAISLRPDYCFALAKKYELYRWLKEANSQNDARQALLQAGCGDLAKP